MKPVKVIVTVKTYRQDGFMAVTVQRVFLNSPLSDKSDNEVHYPLGSIKEITAEAPSSDGKFKPISFINLDFDHSHVPVEGFSADAVFMPQEKFKHIIQLHECYAYTKGNFSYFDFVHETKVVFRLKFKMNFKTSRILNQEMRSILS